MLFFEVVGLLQAEMSKTQDRKITFANSEPVIINLVMDWFNKALNINFSDWRWYVKLNQKPLNEDLKSQIDSELEEYWITESKISYEKMNKTVVSYIRQTTNNIAANNGTLIIEYNSKIITTIIQNMLNVMQEKITNCTEEQIIYFMRGIIAGEGCIEINEKYKKI